MATYTSFLNLEKPTTSERLDVLKINSNWDKIDAGVSALNNQIASETVNMSQYLISAESEATCIMLRCGKVRTMTFQGVARVHTEDEVFMTVPEGDRVKGGNYIHCIGIVGGTPVVVRFNGSSGNISIFILNGGTSNSRLYFQISWVTP